MALINNIKYEIYQKIKTSTLQPQTKPSNTRKTLQKQFQPQKYPQRTNNQSIPNSERTPKPLKQKTTHPRSLHLVQKSQLNQMQNPTTHSDQRQSHKFTDQSERIQQQKK